MSYQNGNSLKVITLRVTLDGTKQRIEPPSGTSEVGVKCATDVTYFEKADKYLIEGKEYGEFGFTSNSLYMPVNGAFYLKGTNGSVADIMFVKGV